MRILKPFRSPPLRRLWIGLSVSAVGDQLQRMAVAWLSVQLLGARSSLVASAESATMLAAALLIGGWTDRCDGRRLMILADLLRAGLAVIPVAAALLGRLGAGTLLVSTIGLAILRTAFDPALQAALPRLASGRLLIATNALMDATSRLARLIGPALAGALAVALPTVGLMLVDAASFLVSAAALAGLKRSLPPGPPPARQPMLASLLRGVRAVSGRPLFVLLLWRGGVVNGLWVLALWVCLPLAVHQGAANWAGGGLRLVGLIMGAYGAGNILGNLIVGELRIARPVAMILLGNVIVGAGLVALGLALIDPRAGLAGLLAAAAFAALGGPMSDVPFATLRQTAFAPDETPAVYRLFMVADWTGILLATAAGPLVLTTASPVLVLTGCGVGIIVTAMSSFAFQRGRRRAPTATRATG